MAVTGRMGMAALEEEIRGIQGVLGAVVFKDPGGNPVEIQVFTRADVPESEIRRSIGNMLSRRGKAQTPERIYIFELAGEKPPGRIGAPNVAGATAAAEGVPAESAKGSRRPRVGRISLASADATSHATVSLLLDGREAEGLGRARKTPYGLRVTAAATLEAAQALLGESGLLALEGAGLVEALGRRMVVVLVHSALFGGRLVLGAALVGSTPVHEATVRATLDAVNRQLELAISG